MGCDIHAHFEIKVDGEWLHFSQPSIQRNYSLFARIANVRNYYENAIEPISKPKGLPEDISKTTKLCFAYWEDDAHDTTWLNAGEIEQMCKFAEAEDKLFEHKQLGYLFENGWGDWKDYPKSYPSFIQDIRFICWFDN